MSPILATRQDRSSTLPTRTIFVSYAHEDAGWISALDLDKAHAGTSSAEFWIDRSGIHAGDCWPTRAVEAASKAGAAVLLVSEHLLRSRAVLEEELPVIQRRYAAGEMALVFVPIGNLDLKMVGEKLRVAQPHTIMSVPAWSTPLPTIPERRPDIRDQIISAATETIEIQNLRRVINPKYRLERVLGGGVLGPLVIAHDTQLDRKVCVKVLQQESQHFRFDRLVSRVARATDHTNVLTIYGAYLDSIPAHLIRQYVEGRSLRSLLEEQRRPLPAALVQEMLATVGNAILHAHREDVDDLTIKPTSIIVSDLREESKRQFHVSLSSYHDEALLDDAYRRGGAPNRAVYYLPPEYRVSSRNDCDPRRADQYRLGVIAYEMLVGAELFEQIALPLGERELAPGWQWPSLVLTHTNGAPEALLEVVGRMVSIDPSSRYASLADAIRDIAPDLNLSIARECYSRIMATRERQTAFFRAFYTRFLEAFPMAKQRFFASYQPLQSQTDLPEEWNRQFQKLKEAVLLLLVFSAFKEDQHEPNILTRIVEGHAQLAIPSWMYKPFGEALVDCIVEQDDPPEQLGRAQLRRAWECVIEPGVSYMQRRTDELQELTWRQPLPAATRSG